MKNINMHIFVSVALLVVKLEKKKHCKNSIGLFQLVLLNVGYCFLIYLRYRCWSVLLLIQSRQGVIVLGSREIRCNWSSWLISTWHLETEKKKNISEGKFHRRWLMMLKSQSNKLWWNFVFWSWYILYVFLLLPFCSGFTVVQHTAQLLVCLINK